MFEFLDFVMFFVLLISLFRDCEIIWRVTLFKKESILSFFFSMSLGRNYLYSRILFYIYFHIK